MKDDSTGSDVINAALLRLKGYRDFSDGAETALAEALRGRIVRVGAGLELQSPGDRSSFIRIVLSGWLARYKMLEDGRRQVIGFILPGDPCNTFDHLLGESQDSIVSLTSASYAEIDRVQFDKLLSTDARLAEAFLCDALVNLAVAREWIVNVGRRVALERVAHLLCEIAERLRRVDLVDGDSCAFPVTQIDLADATGLSIVHLNRTLQELRGSGLIVLRDRTLTILDQMMLQSVALFQPNYLC